MQEVVVLFCCFFVLRLISLGISLRNEKRIKALGGVQYGKVNSMLLTHCVLFFVFI